MSDDAATYTFLPWVRRGISNSITSEPEGVRAEIKVILELNTSEASTNVQLIGPGDIIGINRNEIVRTEPRDWITNVEPNYLPFIEFYDEDFPWRYSPSPADFGQHRLSPWLHLLILKEDEFERKTISTRPLPYIDLIANRNEVFPDSSQTWAWAHVHVNKSVSQDGIDSLVKSNPDMAISRLLGCRKLEEKTGYYAFLIPAFETGRRAGLREEIPGTTKALDSSWSNPNETEYPIYYEWYFRTGIKGDFESLVELLEPREMSPRIGIRDMDVHEPGYGIDELSEKAIVGLEGALKAPSTVSKGFPDDTDKSKFEKELEEIINLQELLKENGTEGIDEEKLIISPPLYGQWHALENTLNINFKNWLNDLNKDPRYRAVSGLGTRVIRKYQDKYMKIAWEEVGDILTVNQKILYFQLSMNVSDKLFTKHLSNLREDAFLQITSQLHSKILGSPTTIYKMIKDSKLPLAALSSSFRRLTRPVGSIMQNFNLTLTKGKSTLVNQLNAGKITAALPKKTPTQIINYDKIIKAIETGMASNTTRREIRAMADNFLTKNFTSKTISKIPLNSMFAVTKPGGTLPKPDTDKDSTEASNFKKALGDFFKVVELPVIQPPVKTEFDMATAVSKIKASISPPTTFLKRIAGFVKTGDIPLKTIVPVMAYPDIKQPMYEALRDISTELLIPNLNLIPQNTISLLETNQPFIEAYMVGLNHEFARELLWREYPTDQRGSYFRQFWDASKYIDTQGSTEKDLAEELKDITPIHTWLDRDLGNNNNREDGEDTSQIVLVIRGEVLKKYPNTVIFAQKAKWMDDSAELEIDKSSTDKIKYPLYGANISPDITFLGFELTVGEAKGDVKEETEKEKERLGNNKLGWFFILQEIPGEPRFGLDVTPEGNVETWEELSWENINMDKGCIDVYKEPKNINISEDESHVVWGSNAADMAYILFQKPMMVAVHAREMLKSLELKE